MSAPFSMIGRTLGHFRILEKLGEGGMGAVYRAQDVTLQRELALKFLSTELAADPTAPAAAERSPDRLAFEPSQHRHGVRGR
jgi:serine/threonine protein kinase